MIPVERLRKFRFFQDAPSALLERLGREMTERAYIVGEVICKEGGAGSALYLIDSGTVSVEKKAFQGEETSKVVARLEAGEFFGEMSFLQGFPHSATVLAQTQTTLFLLSRTSLDEVVKKEPSLAVEHVTTLAMALSNRLRSTTRELVTVFEVARAVGASPSAEQIAFQVVGQLALDLGPTVSVAFYRWNMFNAEYSLLKDQGPSAGQFPSTLEAALDPLPFKKGQFILSPIGMLNERHGLLVVTADGPLQLSSGERQMLETVCAVLAPSLATAQHREEEEARRRLERSKQTGYSL